MPSFAGQSSMSTLRFNFRTLVVAAVPSLRATTSPVGDALVARAMAGAGLAAVLGLPLLLLASLVLGAPLAVPAAIASGYLAISHALASNHPQRAAFISGLVLAALVGWLILYLTQGEESLSRSGMSAALMAPLFAAAPALARSVLACRGEDNADGVAPMARAVALQRVACLDELAPTESVLIADQAGCVLAATRAARHRLRLLPDAFELSMASIFKPTDVPEIVQALGICRARGETAEIALDDCGAGEGRETAAWIVSPCEGEAVSLRRLPRASAAPPALEVKEPDCKDVAGMAPAAAMPASRTCDFSEAVAFAIRRARPRGAAAGIEFAVARDAGIVAACDRQVGRRIAHLAIESALAMCSGGGVIRVDARRLKGIVLLRVTSETSDDDYAEDVSELATLRALVDDVGGTLVLDREPDGRAMLSIRLALIDVATIKERMTERAEAG